MKRLMYIEYKGDEIIGPGRIGWMELSKSKRTYKYNGRAYRKIRGGYKYNCVEEETGEHYWISGPKRNGHDRMYGGIVEIDEDAREDYWKDIRKTPERMNEKNYKCKSIYSD